MTRLTPPIDRGGEMFVQTAITSAACKFFIGAGTGSMDVETRDDIKQEKTDMHCYKTFAASILIANLFEVLPEIGRKLPHAVIADWMAQNGIEPDDVLFMAPDTLKAKLVSLIEHNQPRLSQAA